MWCICLLAFQALFVVDGAEAALELKSVSSTYPYLSKVSGFLAQQYDKEVLHKASLQATDFVMVAALAAETSADVVVQEEERMPFGGFEVPVTEQQMEHGRLYILCGIVEFKSRSAVNNKISPWPQWQLVCGKEFRTDGGKMYNVRYVTPDREIQTESVDLGNVEVKSVIQAAVDDLNHLSMYKQPTDRVHKLVSVLSVELETVDQAQFKKLALTKIPHAIKVYYVYFLTEDDVSGFAPAVPHAAAVMFSEKTGVRLVRQITVGENGYTIIKASCVITGLTVFEFIQPHSQKRFKIGVAKALGQGTEPSDVEITDIAAATTDQLASMVVYQGGDSAGLGKVSGAQWGKGEAVGKGGGRRLWEGVEEVVQVGEVRAVPQEEGGAGKVAGGVAVTFSLCVRGNAKGVRDLMGTHGFLKVRRVESSTHCEYASVESSSMPVLRAAHTASMPATAAASRMLASPPRAMLRTFRSSPSILIPYSPSILIPHSPSILTTTTLCTPKVLAGSLRTAGMSPALSADTIGFSEHTMMSNREMLVSEGLTTKQLLILLVAFVAGVVFTTVRASQLRRRQISDRQ
jgi:hypothetical protein